MVAVVGLQGSGKGAAAEILAKRGYAIIEIGDIWRELVKKAGIDRSDVRATREFTLNIRVKYGKDIYAKYVMKRIKRSMKKVAVFGIRSTYELNYLKSKNRGLKLIALQAPLTLRFKRLRSRAKPEDPKSLSEFRWLETRTKRGFMADKKEEKYGMMAVIKRADYSVTNTGTLAQLDRKLGRILDEIEGAT